MIIKRKGKWFLVSKKTGKNLGGPYDTRKEAEDRMKEVEFFKRQTVKLK